MSLRRVGLVLAATIALVVAAPPLAEPGNRATFQDPAGDGIGDPFDITMVEVANNDAGQLSFAVTLANFSTDDPRASSLELAVFVDADTNTATGNPDGYDYLLMLGESRLWRSIAGGDFSPTPARLRVTRAGQVFTFRVSRRDLSLTDGVRFLIDSNVPAHEARHEDTAGPWLYRVLFGAVTTTLRTSPAAPKAGGRFAASLSVRARGTGAAVTSGTIACNATLASRRLPVLERRFVGPRAVCAWQIPRGAGGTRLRGSITLILNRSRHLSAGRHFDVLVR